MAHGYTDWRRVTLGSVSTGAALAVVVAVTVLGLLAAVLMIRTLRRKTYQYWSSPSRWLWFGLCGLLVALGAFGLVGSWSERWGWPATIWLLGAPLAYGLYRGWPTGHRQP